MEGSEEEQGSYGENGSASRGDKVKTDEGLHLVMKSVKRRDTGSHMAQLKFWLCHGLAVWSWSSSYTSLNLFLFLYNRKASLSWSFPAPTVHGSMIQRIPTVGVMDKQVGNRKVETGGGYKLFQNLIYYDL